MVASVSRDHFENTEVSPGRGEGKGQRVGVELGRAYEQGWGGGYGYEVWTLIEPVPASFARSFFFSSC